MAPVVLPSFACTFQAFLRVRDIDTATAARCLDVPMETVCAWIAGSDLPGRHHLDRLADALDLNREAVARIVQADHERRLAVEAA